MLNTWELRFNSMWRQLFVFVLWLSSGLGRHRWESDELFLVTKGDPVHLTQNQPIKVLTLIAMTTYDKKKQPASALKHQLASFFSSVSPILGHFPRDAQRSTWTTELQSRALPRFPHHAGTTSFRDPRQRATCGAGTAVCWSSALSSPVRIIHHSKKIHF